MGVHGIYEHAVSPSKQEGRSRVSNFNWESGWTYLSALAIADQFEIIRMQEFNYLSSDEGENAISLPNTDMT